MNNKGKIATCRGFTFPEIIIVIVISVPLFVIVGNISLGTFSQWKKGKDRILVDQDIRFFRRRFEKSVRNAPDIAVPAPGLVRLGMITPGAKKEEYEYNSTNKTAIYRNMDLGTSEIIARDVSTLAWSFDTSESIKTKLGIVRLAVSGPGGGVVSSTITFITSSRNTNTP